jgi:SAM-dependent methyltransferase
MIQEIASLIDKTCRQSRAADDFHSSCRICGSDRTIKLGIVEFYVDYVYSIYQCHECGCRFAPYDISAYDLLYREQKSRYSGYTGQADRCKALFDLGDRKWLRAELLAQGPKYRFVICEIDGEPADARILEIGSSRGHLTSYFILVGRTITGVDVSPTAIAAARAAFGNHFVKAGDPCIIAGAPYDVIFHVGTIGCVGDPVGMTRQLLSLLKPGGRLLFNAPNREACSLRDQLWFESAPPPDLVTLFPPGFWREWFSDAACVSEHVEFCCADQNLLIALRKSARRKWRQPIPISIKESERSSAPARRITDVLWGNFERVVRKLAPGIVSTLAPLHPSEFGLMVRMVKK